MPRRGWMLRQRVVEPLFRVEISTWRQHCTDGKPHKLILGEMHELALVSRRSYAGKSRAIRIWKANLEPYRSGISLDSARPRCIRGQRSDRHGLCGPEHNKKIDRIQLLSPGFKLRDIAVIDDRSFAETEVRSLRPLSPSIDNLFVLYFLLPGKAQPKRRIEMCRQAKMPAGIRIRSRILEQNACTSARFCHQIIEQPGRCRRIAGNRSCARSCRRVCRRVCSRS